MDAFDGRLARVLAEKLEAKADELTGLLVSTPSVDYPSYMERVGRVRGLTFALETLREVETQIGRAEVKEDAATAPRRSYES